MEDWPIIVQDPVKWKVAFRTHGDLFRSMKVRDAMHYAITGNEFSVFADTENLDTFSVTALLLPQRYVRLGFHEGRHRFIEC
jgi:hypothetical protein